MSEYFEADRTNVSSIGHFKYHNKKLFMLSMMIVIILPITLSLTACNSFPKIFGGNNGDSYLYQMDVFNDYLA